MEIKEERRINLYRDEESIIKRFEDMEEMDNMLKGMRDVRDHYKKINFIYEKNL